MNDSEKQAIYDKAKAEFRSRVERFPGSFCYDGMGDPVLEKDACEFADWKVKYFLNPPDPASFSYPDLAFHRSLLRNGR